MTNDIAAEVTIAGLKKGLHVFCEKPPGRNVEDIVSVILQEKLSFMIENVSCVVKSSILGIRGQNIVLMNVKKK